MNVLIAGACEQTGRCLADFLVKRTDHKAFAIVRQEELQQALEHMDREHIVTMPENHEELDALTAGMDAFVYAGGCDVKTNDPRMNHSTLEDTKSLIQAAVYNQAGRFILLSAMGADDPQGANEDYLLKKREAEDFLKNSGLDYTVIRAGELTRREPSGKVTIDKDIHWIKDPTVSCADVAKVIAVSLDSEKMINQTLDLVSGDTPIEEAVENM